MRCKLHSTVNVCAVTLFEVRSLRAEDNLRSSIPQVPGPHYALHKHLWNERRKPASARGPPSESARCLGRSGWVHHPRSPLLTGSKRLPSSAPTGNHNPSTSLQEDPQAGAAGSAASLRVSPPWLPGQVPGGSGRRGGAAPGRPAAGSTGKVPAAGARGGAREWGGPGRGRRPRHLIKRLRVSREQRAHSVVGSCPRGGAAGRRARLVPGVGPGAAERGDRGGRGGSGTAALNRPGAQGGHAASRSPPGAPAHGGRGAAVAALPVGGAPAPARCRLQLGHQRGQCDRENRGLREPLRLLAGHAQAAGARGEAAVSSPTLPTPQGRRPAREQGRGRAAFPPAGLPRPGLRRPRGQSGPAPCALASGAARCRAFPHSVPEGGELGGPTPADCGPSARWGRPRPRESLLFFFEHSAFRRSFLPGVFAGNPAGGTLWRASRVCLGRG